MSTRSFRLVPGKITPKFHPLCNQKFAQIKKQEVFLDLRKFLVAEGMKIWSNFVWHQLKRDKDTFRYSSINEYLFIDGQQCKCI